MIEFELCGSIPSKKNSKQIFKTSDGTPFISASANFKAWHNQVMAQLVYPASHVKKPYEHCAVTLVYTVGDRRKRDLSNMTESVMDALVDAKILADDNLFVAPLVTMAGRFEAGVFSCRVIIRGFENAFEKEELVKRQISNSCLF